MIVAGLQIDTAWEDPPENLKRADALAARAAGAGARLVALPEMFATGFSMAADRVAAHADTIRDGLAEIARRHSVWAIGGYAEPAGVGNREGESVAGDGLAKADHESVYRKQVESEPRAGAAPASISFDARPRNACSLFDPAGVERLRYHKIHPFTLAGEDRYYVGGDSLPTADVDGLRVTPLICYDLRFPEPFRAAAERTDLYVVIANWPVARSDAWRTLLRARAIENQAFALGVNRVGEGDGLVYGGDSALIDPFGAALASAAEQAGVVVGEASAEAVEEARARFGFLKDRRAEVYQAL